MPRVRTLREGLPNDVRLQMAELGHNLKVARIRRRITQQVMAERLQVSPETLQRMEKGDPTVSIGAWATALWLFGKQGRLSLLLAPSADEQAQAMDLDDLPERVRTSDPGMKF